MSRLLGRVKLGLPEVSLGSKGRIRVLEILSESGELNISEIARRAGMNYSSIEEHLEKLEKAGLIREKRYGKIRIFEAAFETLTIRFEKGKGVKIEKM